MITVSDAGGDGLHCHIPVCAALENKKAMHARVTRDSATIPRWPSADILDFIELEIPPFDPPTTNTLA